jgi:hypothetical protein
MAWPLVLMTGNEWTARSYQRYAFLMMVIEVLTRFRSIPALGSGSRLSLLMADNFMSIGSTWPLRFLSGMCRSKSETGWSARHPGQHLPTERPPRRALWLHEVAGARSSEERRHGLREFARMHHHQDGDRDATDALDIKIIPLTPTAGSGCPKRRRCRPPSICVPARPSL